MKIRTLLVCSLGAILALATPTLAQESPRTLMELLRGKKAEQQEAVATQPRKPETPKPAAAPVRNLATLRENTGELRSSETVRVGLFGRQAKMLPETQALDGVLRSQDSKRGFKVRSDFEPQTVSFSGYRRGTIVIDTGARYLYLVESSSKARRYAIAVGREGLEFKGSATVGDKQEWPRWFPTKAMQDREPRKYGQYKDGMNGGPENPLGARAIYLYQGRKDTHVRIHGTNQPQTIGTNSSNGCFRMINEHVIDLYGRVKKGTEVVVL